MIVWLDHLIFGNGHGLGSPYFDQRFYWLSGQFYTWIGGHGAQLQSFQWRHPKPGERRRIDGREFVAFQSTRQWIRVRVSWAMVGFPRDIDVANALLRSLEYGLGRI